jgi:hypothetical protein
MLLSKFTIVVTRLSEFAKNVSKFTKRFLVNRPGIGYIKYNVYFCAGFGN